ncbi:hypothetical protein CASFOL_003618 [Castilleja foliolosa]|uniref:KIB1-4 beta-propeller domain-containing protein n=1 Tax=Castilleja foliolosa TaxID=1961234 RepID=A0ABD3EI81_9LAMI
MEAPWLLITDGSHNEKQYLYNISDNRYHRLNGFPEFHDMKVLASAYGWLVLVNPKTDYTYIWNPISMAKIDIGQLNIHDAYIFEKCVMSKPPSEPDCRLVFYTITGGHQAFLQLVDDDNIIHKYLPDDTYRDVMLMAVVSFRGTLYGFLHPGCRFVTIDFDNETVEFRPILKLVDQQPWDMPWPNREWALYWDDHMIESPCGQELLLVRKMFLCQFSPDKFDFRVFRLDVERKEYVELDSIGDRAIFISHCGGGFCCDTGIFRRNCIYYTVKQGMSRSVYVYDFNYRSTTLLLPCSAARLTLSANYWVERRVFGI